MRPLPHAHRIIGALLVVVVTSSCRPTRNAAGQPLLPVPATRVPTFDDETLRARTTSADVGDTFPWRPAPSLSGPLRGLAFGVPRADAEKAMLPSSAIGPGKFTPVFGPEGLRLVEIRYPSVTVARAALEPAWGPPHREALKSGELFTWKNAAHAIRATMIVDGDEPAILVIEPYVRAAELLADGGELSWRGRHLLDWTREELRGVWKLTPSCIDIGFESVGLVATEEGVLTSLIVPTQSDWKLPIASYTLVVDTIPDAMSALERHFGPRKKHPVGCEPLFPGRDLEPCWTFPATAAGVRAEAVIARDSAYITIRRE